MPISIILVPLLLTSDLSVFSGEYVTGDIDEEYFAQLERQRSDSVRNNKPATSEEVVGLFNNSPMK